MHLLLDKGVCFRTKSRIYNAVLNWKSPCRNFINDRDIQISIQYDSKCSRNRSCTHNKNVWSCSFFRKRFSLTYPKTVLLIRNYQCQIRIDCFLLNECMSTDDHRIRFLFKSLIGKPFLLCSHRTGQQNDRKSQSKLFAHLAIRFIVLSCKYFSRSHNCRLVTACCRPRHRKKSHDRLTGSNISLDQSLHHIRALHIMNHVIQSTLLCARQFIRKLSDTIGDNVRLSKGKIVTLTFLLFFLILHSENKQKKLVKNKASSCFDQRIKRIRKVNLLDRIIVFT